MPVTSVNGRMYDNFGDFLNQDGQVVYPEGTTFDANGLPIWPTGTTPTTPTTPTGDSTGLSLVSNLPAWGGSANNTLQGGINRANDPKNDHNTDHVQGSQQQGAFESTGQTSQNTAQLGVQNQQGTSSQQGTQSNQQANWGQQGSLGSQTQSGSSSQTTNGNQSTASQQNQTGSQASTGTQSTTGTSGSAGSTSSTGQSLSSGSTVNTGQTGVVDTLGLGSLIKSQAQGAIGQDAARNAFLQDVMANGGTGYQSQMQQAINNSLSGPGMSGTGEMAKGRVAGAAAANIARNNMDQRLNAAQQLTSGGQFGSLAGLGDAYLGKTSSEVGQTANNTVNQQAESNQTSSVNSSNSQNTNNSTNNSSTSGTSNTSNSQATNSLNQSNTATAGQTNTVGGSTGSQATSQTGATSQNGTSLNLGSLVSNEKQSGQSIASSLQAATGQIPQQQQSGGGCYVCTAYASFGLMDPEKIRLAAKWKLDRLHKYGTSLHGYSIYGPWLARKIRKYKWVRSALYKYCALVLAHECYLAGEGQATVPSKLAHSTFHYGSIPFSWVARLFGNRAITTPHVDAEALRAQQLYFDIQHKV